MNRELLEKIVNVVLYEGYILYPYRPSVKNHQRWTFGGLYPENYDLVRQGAESCVMQTQCLLEGTEKTTLVVSVRFLHLTTRIVGELPEPIDELPADAQVIAAPAPSPSPRTRGEGWGEGDFERQQAFDTRNRPLPSPPPAYRERGQEDGEPGRVGVPAHRPVGAEEVGEYTHPTISALGDSPSLRYRAVDSLRVGGKIFQSWQEASEREITLESHGVSCLEQNSVSHSFTVPPSEEIEPLRREDGKIAGVLIRQQKGLAGVVELSAEKMVDNLFKVSVRVINRSPMPQPQNTPRDVAQLYSLASTHTILSVEQGAWVSSIDPPERCLPFAGKLRNVGAWPVLVGTEPDRDTMLASPIILYDYPQIAPESPNNLFDSTEIDEILSLRIMTLTDEEKQAVAGADERGARILERTDAMGRDDLAAMHGTVRGLRPVASEGSS